MLISKQIYDRLITAYGQPDWWSGTPYVIMVTAILVQNTAWSNVEKAVAEMGERLMPEYIDSLTEEELQPLIRSQDVVRILSARDAFFRTCAQPSPIHQPRHPDIVPFIWRQLEVAKKGRTTCLIAVCRVWVLSLLAAISMGCNPQKHKPKF